MNKESYMEKESNRLSELMNDLSDQYWGQARDPKWKATILEIADIIRKNDRQGEQPSSQEWTPTAEMWQSEDVQWITVDAKGQITQFSHQPVVNEAEQCWMISASSGSVGIHKIGTVDMSDMPEDWWKTAIWERPKGINQ